MMRFFSFCLATVLMLSPAFAHTGVGDTSGFSHGFLHPISGIDHVLVMVAVGVLAALLGGRALWLLPAAFLAMMAVGGALGMAGVNVPFVETGIGLSIVVLGLTIAMHLSVPVLGALALTAIFAVFHGHAHGTEMPDSTSGLAYGAGFVLATALLHLFGIGLGMAGGGLGTEQGRPLVQMAGASMALVGLAILTGLI